MNDSFTGATASILSIIEEKPRFVRRVLDEENPKVIIELTNEKVDLVNFVEYVLNFEERADGK